MANGKQKKKKKKIRTIGDKVKEFLSFNPLGKDIAKEAEKRKKRKKRGI